MLQEKQLKENHEYATIVFASVIFFFENSSGFKIMCAHFLTLLPLKNDS